MAAQRFIVTHWTERLESSRPAVVMLMLFGVGLWIAHGWAMCRYPLGNDPAIFQYHGWALTVGEVPYRDALEFNSPGIIFLHWTVGALAGFSDGVFLLFTLLVSTLAAWTPLINKHLHRNPSAWLAAMVATLWAYGAITPWDRGQRELFQGIFLLAAFGLGVWVQKSHSDQVRRGCHVGIGVLMGAAVTIKITIAALIVPIVVVWLTAERLRNQRPLKHCFATAGWIMLGVGFPVAAILLWIQTIGAWDGFWWTQWQYLPIHRDQIAVSLPEAMSKPLPWVVLLTGISALAVTFIQRSNKLFSLLILGSALVGSVALYLLQGKGWTYHLHIALPLLGLTVGLLVQHSLPPNGCTARLAVWLGSLAVLVVVAGNTHYDHREGLVRGEHVGSHWNYPAHQQVATLLQSEGAPSDRVLVNNDEQQLLAMAQRRSATWCMYGFLCSESQPKPFLASLGLQRAAQVNDRAPDWVVWNDRPYRPALDELSANPLIEAWITRRCSLRTTIPPYRVWRCTELP
jgi:hypothetical protein